METFISHQEILAHCGSNYAHHPSLVAFILKKDGLTPDNASAAEITQATTNSKEAYEAMSFLSGLNVDRYQDLLDELANSYLNGRDEYPKNLVATYKLVTNWKGKTKPPRQNYNDGVNFNTMGEEEVDGQTHLTTDDKILCRRDGTPVRCIICGENHYPNKCPNKNTDTASISSKPPIVGSSNTTVATPSTITDLPPATNITTVNAKKILTVAGDEKPTDTNSWDQVVDYSGLSFSSRMQLSLTSSINPNCLHYHPPLRPNSAPIHPSTTMLFSSRPMGPSTHSGPTSTVNQLSMYL